MAKAQLPQQPLSMLPKIADMLDCQLGEIRHRYDALLAVQDRPYLVDSASVERVIDATLDQQEMLAYLYEQAARWMGEMTSADQRASIERFQALLTLVATGLADVLILASEISVGTIDKIMAMSDIELAAGVLKGDIPFPDTPNCARALLDEERRGIAAALDQRMQELIGLGLDDIDILGAMHDTMARFKRLMDAGNDEFNQLLRQFPGLKQYAKLLESMAARIQSGEIIVPK